MYPVYFIQRYVVLHLFGLFASKFLGTKQVTRGSPGIRPLIRKEKRGVFSVGFLNERRVKY